MAFGTGSHATTQLCLEQLIHAIDRRRDERLRVLDMGCGSGILAISCKKLGADDVLAVDIDPIAVTTTRDNAIANQAEITTQAAAEPIVGPFDIVVANILSQPLKVLAPALARLVRPKGSLLLSGILARQAEEILEAYRPSVQHLNPLGVLQEREGWVCIGTRE
jgi:ribosomal protein L11 methyltransferase